MRKELVVNLSANLITQVITIGSPLLVQFHLVRNLKLSDLGTWYLVTASIALLHLVITFPHYELVKRIASSEQISRLLGTAYLLGFINALVLAPIFVYYLVEVLNIHLGLTLIACTLLVSTPIASEFFFQGKIKSVFVLQRKTLVKVILVIGTLLLVRGEDDFYKFFILSILCMAMEHIICFGYVLKNRLFGTPDWSVLKGIVTKSWLYIPFRLSYNTLPHISLIAFKSLVTLELLAIYSIFMRIVNVATTAVTSSMVVLFPYSINKQGIQENTMQILGAKLLVCTGLIAMMIIFQDYVLWFFLNQKLEGSLQTEYIILTFFIVIHTTYNFLIFNQFLSKSKLLIPLLTNILQLSAFFLCTFIFTQWSVEHFYSVSIIVSSLVNLTLLVVFIYLNNRLVRVN